MKNYIKTLNSKSKLWERILWWALRCVMIAGIINSAFVRKDIQQVLQMTANLVGIFAWEICMATSEKRILHYLPSYIQDIAAPGFFLASFGGAYLDFYYSIPNYDIILHLLGGAAGTWFGYEIITALQKRDKTRAHLSIVLMAALGFSFILGNGWELFEFTFDQVAGGDSQHWSMELAKQAAAEHGIGLPNVLSALCDERYALIDTMEDMICNTIGSVVMYIILKKRPYHHKGKFAVDFEAKAGEKAEVSVK